MDIELFMLATMLWLVLLFIIVKNTYNYFCLMFGIFAMTAYLMLYMHWIIPPEEKAAMANITRCQNDRECQEVVMRFYKNHK